MIETAIFHVKQETLGYSVGYGPSIVIGMLPELQATYENCRIAARKIADI